MKILQKLAPLCAILFAMVSCSNCPKGDLPVAIVPQPNQLVRQDGAYTVTKKTSLVLPGSEKLQNVADLINQRFSQAAGFKLEVTDEQPESNFIAVELEPEWAKGDEAYELIVDKSGVMVKAGTERGAFYGLVSMLQLLPPAIESTTEVDDVCWSIPFVQIDDAPRFAWRGMHLDVCRHFVPVKFIKKQLDVMALFKMNTFHWHLTEDQGWRIEIKKIPETN